MNKSQDIQTFSTSSFNSKEKLNYFYQYETEDFYDDEIACKANIWRKDYLNFLEKKINEIEYK